jgi:HNH endonuclease
VGEEAKELSEMSDRFGDDIGRPSIPADIRRRVLMEAGHRCAIPTCRYIEVDVHHIIPWAKCQKHEYENLIALCPNCHRRAGNEDIDRKALRLYKLNLRFAHDKFSQLEMDILFDAYTLTAGHVLLWPPVMQIMLKRLLESGYILIQPPGGAQVSMGGLRMSPDHLSITAKGRAFVEELGLHEL